MGCRRLVRDLVTEFGDDLDKRIPHVTECVSPKDVAHTTVLLTVTPVEGDSVVEPVVVNAFETDEISVAVRIEGDEFAVKTSTRRGDAYTLWSRIYTSHFYPWCRDVEPRGCVESCAPIYLVPDDRDLIDIGVMHRSNIQNRDCTEADC